MAKHVATIRAKLSFHGMSVLTTFLISKRSPFSLAVKHRKSGGYNLILFQKSLGTKIKKSRSPRP